MIEFEISTNKKQIEFDITQGIPKYVPANFQSKTVIPTTEQQIVRADFGYDGLEQVTVEPIKVLDKTITENGTYNAESDNLNGYSSVEVNVQPTLQEKSITITENGTTEVVADSGYDGLTKVSVEANVQDSQVKDLIEGTITEISNSNVTTVKKYGISYCDNLTKVELPNAISIGNYGISNNQNLSNLHIPNVTSIGNYGISNNQNLSNLHIPNVTSIGDYGLYNNLNLKNLILSNELSSLGRYALSRNSGITKFIFTSNLTTIGSGCCEYCTKLIDVEAKEGEISIPDYMFYGSGVENVDIPNVVSIGNVAFMESNIKRINAPNVVSIGNGAFRNLHSNIRYSFPKLTSLGEDAFRRSSIYSDGVNGLTAIYIFHK